MSVDKPIILNIHKIEEDDELNDKILEIVRSIRDDFDNIILCGFEGANPPRTEGKTFGIAASEIADEWSSDICHPVYYAINDGDANTRQQPAIAMYDRNLLKKTSTQQYRILTKEALLAVIHLLL